MRGETANGNLGPLKRESSSVPTAIRVRPFEPIHSKSRAYIGCLYFLFLLPLERTLLQGKRSCERPPPQSFTGCPCVAGGEDPLSTTRQAHAGSERRKPHKLAQH